MTDAERVRVLRRAGFARTTIAAIIGATYEQVNAVVVDPVNAPPLPASGGGVVVGAWEDLDYGDFPHVGDPPVLAFDVLDVPCEIEVEWIPTAGAFGGFYLQDVAAEGFVDFATKTTAGDAAISNADRAYMRSIVPAGAEVELHYTGTEDWRTGVIMQNVRRRPLG